LPLPYEPTVRAILAAREPLILGAVLAGWQDYQRGPDANRWRRKSSRAALVWERTIEHLIDGLIDDSGVHILEHHDTVSFVVDDQDLFGYSGLHRVHVVYILNQLETKIESICVVARNGDEVLWWYELAIGAEAVIPLPFQAPALPPAADVAKLRTSKDIDKRKGE